jgi:5-methylcytosine-specific restriction protein A
MTYSVCTQSGCGEIVERGHGPCRAHARQDARRRGTAARRGYGTRWKAERDAYLRLHPLCAHCLVAGRTTAASVVDHVVPHRGDARLFWLPTNRQSLCADHHGSKIAREEGRAACADDLEAVVDGRLVCAKCGGGMPLRSLESLAKRPAGGRLSVRIPKPRKTGEKEQKDSMTPCRHSIRDARKKGT